MTRHSTQTPPHATLATLTAAVLCAGGLMCAPATAAPEAGNGIVSPWSTFAESHSATDFLTTALPVAANKSDLDNASVGFFRTPTPTAHEPGTILYVGLRAEPAPDIEPYSSPLFSGSIESFDLGIGGARPVAQTVGDIGEIFPEDAPPTPMAYIVYRLDFSTRSNDKVALFAIPTVRTEPFTTSAPDALDANFAWESISFSNFGLLEEQEKDWEDGGKSRKKGARALAAPEPASAALFSLGLLALVLRRRQRSR